MPQPADIEELRRDFMALRFGMFIHFNMGTYHGKEWVDPGQDPMSFAPDRLDIGQWADVAKSAGMTYGCLTTKHHDGFCLWDSKVSDYSVAKSPLAGRDLVAEYCETFRSRGLEPHFYFSIWDRTLNIDGAITRTGMEQIKAQLGELLSNYGFVRAITFDGWSSGSPTAVWQEDQRDEIFEHVWSIQPHVLMGDHYQLRRGLPYEEVYKKIGFLQFEEAPPVDEYVPEGNVLAAQQGPCLQPLWFWKENFPTAPLMSVDDIVEKRLKVFRNRASNLLLNCAPNPHGLMDDNVVRRMAEVGRAYIPWAESMDGKKPT